MINNTVLITGSSRGLGLDIAIQFSKLGYRTVLTGRNEEDLKSALTKLDVTYNRQHFYYRSDLTAIDGPLNLCQYLANNSLLPDVVVNSLGGSVEGDCKNISTAALRNSMRLNLEVSMEINALLYSHLKSVRGIILHVGSTASLHHDAPPGYVISKSALNAYVKNASRSFAKDDITIFAVLPGMLDHDGSYARNLEKTNPERYASIIRELPFNSLTSSKDTARFIASIVESNTKMVSGSIISFDGGKD